MKNVGDLCILLKKRSLLFDFIVNESLKLSELVGKAFYFGIDPTSNFLHIGHIQYFIIAKILCDLGMKFVVVIGDFTVRIGDYSFRADSRKAISDVTIDRNVEEICDTVGMVCNNIGLECTIVRNSDWLSELSVSDFISSICKVNFKDSARTTAFKRRFDSSHPMYLHELLYPHLQAYDFLYLFKQYSCVIQIGGQDQFYNMICGIKLIKRYLNTDSWLLSLPLLLSNSGEKLGKSEGSVLCKFNSGCYGVFYFICTLLNQSYTFVSNLAGIVTGSSIVVSDRNSLLIAIEKACCFLYKPSLVRVAIKYLSSGDIDNSLVSSLEHISISDFSSKKLLKLCVPDMSSAMIESAVSNGKVLINGVPLLDMKLIGSMFTIGKPNVINVFYYYYLFVAI